MEENIPLEGGNAIEEGGTEETSFIYVDEDYYDFFSQAANRYLLKHYDWEEQELYEAARGKYMSKNKGAKIPSWIDLKDARATGGNTRLRAEMQMGIIENIKERFFKVDLSRLEFQTGDKGQIQVQYMGRNKWYDVFQRKDPNKLNSKLSKEIIYALGPENLRIQKENLDSKIEDLETITSLKETIEEREKEYYKQNKTLLDAHKRETEYNSQEMSRILNERNKALKERDAAKRELKDYLNNKEIDDLELQKASDVLKKEIADIKEDRNELIREIKVKELQLQQREQAIEDLEQQAERQREVIRDQNKTEEEIEAAKEKLEGIQERIAEMESTKENLERELGLTRREKIKRLLQKAGMGVVFAGAVAGIVSLIMNIINPVGVAVKKLGNEAGKEFKKLGKQIADTGKKLAAAIPGLLGSVLSLILKTGGELLKFLGNNIWILVVALGAVLLKSLTEKSSRR